MTNDPIQLANQLDEAELEDFATSGLADEAAQCLREQHAEIRRLREAAQAVVDRWETPLWKDAPATAGFIADLRKALEPKP